MKIDVKLPDCCGKVMRLHAETTTLYEVRCDNCGDVIFVKKEKASKPTMLDD
jgi:DNA-directed RNA polymerase subunit RPC12/RpoP